MVRLSQLGGQVTMEPVRKLSAVSPASSGSTPKTLACGLSCLTAAATPAKQAAAGDGSEDEVDIGSDFDDFKAAGGLAGDDLLVVVGRNDDVAVLADQFVGFGKALAGGDADIDDLSAHGERGGALDGGGVGGHDDDGFGADFARGIGYALGVVAAGIGDDAAGDFFRGELEDLVGRAADFECADGLEGFGFEVDFFAGAVAGEAGELGADERGLDGDIGDAAAAARISARETVGLAWFHYRSGGWIFRLKDETAIEGHPFQMRNCRCTDSYQLDS